MYWLVAIFFLAGVLAWMLSYPVHRELLRRELIDRPNARSSHRVPTPRGGGIAIVTVIAVGYAALAAVKQERLPLILLGCVLLLAFVSFIDDLRPLSARIRFAVHAMTAIAMIGSFFAEHHLVWSLASSFALLVCFCWIVGYTNAYNFMDGINGIASMQASLTGVGTAIIAIRSGAAADSTVPLLALIVAGAAFGFLPHNFPKARMFMGDVGSAPVGFLLASLAVVVVLDVGLIAAVPLFLLHCNYVLDTSITLMRRFLRGEKVYQAHKEHFYQRMVRAGKSHSYTTCWECGLQILTLLIVCIYQRVDGFPERFTLVVSVFLLWLGFFAYAEYLFGKTKTSSNSDGTGAPIRSPETFVKHTCDTI